MSVPVAWLGGDPGMSGAIALICPLAVEIGDPVGVQVFDMAATVGGDRVLNMRGMAQQLEAWKRRYDILGATVEQVSAMPGQGVTSMFTFGGTYMALRQALASAGIHETLVRPGTWKVIYRLKGGRENKGMSREAATARYPDYKHLWTRAKDDGRAEAVLLADYGSKLRNAK